MLHNVAKFNLGFRGEYLVYAFIKGDSGDGSNLTFSDISNVKYNTNQSNLIIKTEDNRNSSAVVRFKKNTSGKRKFEYIFFNFSKEDYIYSLGEVAPKQLVPNYDSYVSVDLWNSYEKGLMSVRPGTGFTFSREYEKQFPKSGRFDFTFRFSIEIDSTPRIFTLRMIANE